jgi:hypothetical protein
MFKDNQGRQSDIVARGDGHRRRCYKCCFADRFGIRFCRWIFGYVIVLASLWGLAVSCHQMATTIELKYVGETIKIPLLPLWSRTILQIKSNAQDPGLEIYQFSPIVRNEVAECPLLNGPSVTVESNQTFTLDPTQFAYDSFHLNAGSTIMVDAHQHYHQHGLTNIYLLRGFRHLEALKHHEESSYDFRAHSIRKGLVGQGGATLRYQVEEDDFYIVVYSNDSWESKASHLNIIVTITLATHSLENKTPVCTAHQTMNDGCFWDLLNNRERRQLALSCLVAKAVSAEIDTATNTTHFIDNTTGLQENVVFQIGGPFRYELLFWLTIMMLGLFWLTAKTTSAWLHQQKYSPGALDKSSSEQTLLNDMQQLSSSSSETSYQAIESS